MSTITETRIQFQNISHENCVQLNQKQLKPGTISQKGTQHDSNNHRLIEKIGTDPNFKHKILWWPKATLYTLFHCFAVWGLYLTFTAASWKSILFMYAVHIVLGQSITLGAHRLYSHKSFKASILLRLLIVFCHTATGQDSMFKWVKDHRQHHKYSDTDADPQSPSRGFFFAHVGWIVSNKHPLVVEKGKQIDMSDLIADPIVMFQKRHYKIIHVFTTMLLVGIPMYFWNESFKVAFLSCYVLIIAYIINITSTANSVAHSFGMKPFDKNILAVESFLVTFLTSGEGWHNYHHCFPRDYRASEFGAAFNITSKLIEAFAYLGLASHLKSAPESSIKHKTIKHGDGSHSLYGNMKYDPRTTKQLTQEF